MDGTGGGGQVRKPRWETWTGARRMQEKGGRLGLGEVLVWVSKGAGGADVFWSGDCYAQLFANGSMPRGRLCAYGWTAGKGRFGVRGCGLGWCEFCRAVALQSKEGLHGSARLVTQLRP